MESVDEPTASGPENRPEARTSATEHTAEDSEAAAVGLVASVRRWFHLVASYEGPIIPLPLDRSHAPGSLGDDVATAAAARIASVKPQLIGTVLGVYLPCVQNIFGVILFIRLFWVVGMAGWLEAFAIVFLCCCCTITTAISMSVVSCNALVATGGSYFLISRTLGAEFGGAVGLLFYIGNMIATAIYIIGAVEILLKYLLPPEAWLFGSAQNPYTSYRIYGTVLHCLLFLLALIGIRVVSKLSPPILFCVLGSICCVYIGIFTANPSTGPRLCFIGDRLLARSKLIDPATGLVDCTKNSSGVIYIIYCGNESMEVNLNASCIYLRDHEVAERPGVPGISGALFLKNMYSSYSVPGSRIGSQERGDADRGDILCDASTSFVVLAGIFFPAVTGFMAGTNRAESLENAQRSIPLGTLSAVAFTSAAYLSMMFLLASSVEGQLLRDKYGESLGNNMVLASFAWPSPWVVQLGSFCSTLGAGVQSLVGAPRLLQALAADDVMPFLRVFSSASKHKDPIRALLITTAITEAGILLADLDNLATLSTLCFLMCYCCTNLACARQVILEGSGRPSPLKYYHWSLSVFGVCLSLALLFMANCYYAASVILIAAGIYKYVEYYKGRREWGDGVRGASTSAAHFSLLQMEGGDVPPPPLWRPQLLLLHDVRGRSAPEKLRHQLQFIGQMRESQGGLLIVASVLEGDSGQGRGAVDEARAALQGMRGQGIKGFAEVIVADRTGEGLRYLVQGAGLGALRHNAVLMLWPDHWKTSSSHKAIGDTLRTIHDRRLALMMVKGITAFPDNSHRLTNTIDIWCLSHEGLYLMLIPSLMRRHPVWRRCQLRIFTLSEVVSEGERLMAEVRSCIDDLGEKASIELVHLPDLSSSREQGLAGNTAAESREGENHPRFVIRDQDFTIRDQNTAKRDQIVTSSKTSIESNIEPCADESLESQVRPVREVHATADCNSNLSLTEPDIPVKCCDNIHVENCNDNRCLNENFHRNRNAVNNRQTNAKSNGSCFEKLYTTQSSESKEKDKYADSANCESQNYTENFDSAQSNFDCDFNDIDIHNRSFIHEDTCNVNHIPIDPNCCDSPHSLDSMTNTNTPDTPDVTLKQAEDSDPLISSNGESVAVGGNFHSVTQTNERISELSKDADLIVIVLPIEAPLCCTGDSYMEYLDHLTRGLDRVLLLRGGETEGRIN